MKSATRRTGSVNIKLMVKLLLGLAVVGTGVHFLHAYMVERNARSLFERAETLLDAADEQEQQAATAEYEAKGQLLKDATKKRTEATRHLNRYLQLEPDHSEAWELFATTSDKTLTDGRRRRTVYERFSVALRNVEGAWEEALRNNQQEEAEQLLQSVEKLRRRLIEVAMDPRVQQYNQAWTEIETLSKENPEDAQLYFWRGIVLLRLEDEKQDDWQKAAAESFDQALAKDPEMINAYHAMINLIQGHSRDFPYRDYDPSGRESPSAEEVVEGLAQQMVEKGRPQYQAYQTRTIYRQQQSVKAEDEQLRDKYLKAAIADVEEAVKKRQELLQQENTGSETAANTDFDPKKDVTPLLLACEIFRIHAGHALQYGQLEEHNERLAKARQFAKAAKEQVPSNLKSHLLLARTVRQLQNVRGAAERDYAEALNLIREGLDQIPEVNQTATSDEIELRLLLAETMLQAGYWKTVNSENEDRELTAEEVQINERHDQLAEAYQLLKDRGASRDRIAFLQAQELTFQGKWHEASLAWEDLQEKFLGNPQLSLLLNRSLSQCYANMGFTHGQLDALQRAKNLAPLMFSLRVEIAMNLKQLGRIDDALEEIRLTNYGVPGVGRTIADLVILREFEKPLSRRDWEVVYRQLGTALDLLKRAGRHNSLDWTISKIKQFYALVYQADVLFKDDPDKANKIVERVEAEIQQAIQDQPDEPLYWSVLAAVRFWAAGHADEDSRRELELKAIATLDEATQALGDRAAFRATRAEYLTKIAQGDEEIRQTLVKIAALGDDPLPESANPSVHSLGNFELTQLWNGVAMASLQLASMTENAEIKTEAIDQSRKYVERVVAHQPHLIPYRLLLVHVAITQADIISKSARDLISQIKRIQQKPAQQRTPEESERLAKMNEQLSSLRAAASEQFGEIARLARDIRTYEGEDGPNGDYAEALPLLVKYQFSEMLNQAGVADDSSQPNKAELAKAAQLLESAQKRQPEKAILASTLGQIEQLRGNEDAAIDQYLRAVELKDYAPRTMSRLISLLRRRNRNDQIAEITSRIRQREPDRLKTPADSVGFSTSWTDLAVAATTDVNRFEQAKEILDQITEDPDTDFEYHLRVGTINLEKARRAQQVDTTEGIEPHFRKAAELASDKPAVWFSLVGYLLESGKRPAAEQAIEDAETKLQGPARAITLAQLYRAIGQNEKAATEYETALKQSPQNYVILEQALEFYRRTGQADVAEERLKAALSRDGQNPLLHSVAANFYAKTFTLGKTPEAKAERKKLAIIYLDKILDRKDELSQGSTRSARRRKAILVGATRSHQQNNEAVKLIDVNLTDRREIRDLRAKAQILKNQATFQSNRQVIELLEEIAALGQITPTERYNLARMYVIGDDWDNARKHLLILIEENDRQPQYLIEYVNGLIREGDLLSAENEINALANSKPDSIALALLKSALLESRDDQDGAAGVLGDYLRSHKPPAYDQEARRELKKLAQAGSDSFEDLLTKFRDFTTSTQNPAAAKSLAKVEQLHQDQRADLARAEVVRFLVEIDVEVALYIDRMQAVAKSLEKLGAIDEAEGLYHEFVKLSERPDAELTLAAFLGRQGRITEAVDICEAQWGKANPIKVAGISVSLIRKGNAAQDDLNRVNDRIERAVEQNPQSVSLLLHLAALRDYQRRDADAEKIYREILSKDELHLLANNNLAWLLAMRESDNSNHLNEALELVNRAINSRGPLAQFLDTRATIYMKMGEKTDITQAINDLQEAIAVTDNEPAILVNLARAHLMNDDFVEAKKAMLNARRLGLTEEDLHPREHESYRELLDRLRLGGDDN